MIPLFLFFDDLDFVFFNKFVDDRRRSGLFLEDWRILGYQAQYLDLLIRQTIFRGVKDLNPVLIGDLNAMKRG